MKTGRITSGPAPDTTGGSRAGSDWRHRAVCREEDPELFFPPRGETHQHSPVLKAAKAVCARCPVRRDCLVAALREERHLGDYDIHGIRGGLTTDERRALTRDWGTRGDRAPAGPAALPVREPGAKFPPMSPGAIAAREVAVREGFAEGLTDAQIAARIGVGCHAVGKIRKRLGLVKPKRKAVAA